jgi:hypothetical protein
VSGRSTSLAAMLPTGVLLLVLLSAAAVFVGDGVRVVAFPYPADYGEGPLLAQTLRLGHLESIYRSDLTSPPYTVSNYPPLYPLVLSPLARLWGPAFWYGRLLSWLSVGAAAMLIGLILTRAHPRPRRGGDRWPLAARVPARGLLVLPLSQRRSAVIGRQCWHWRTSARAWEGGT